MLRKCYQKCVGLIIKIPYLRTTKQSKDWLDDILHIFFNYFNVIKAQSKFDLKGYKKKVRIKHEHFFMFARLKTL